LIFIVNKMMSNYIYIYIYILLIKNG